MIQRVCSLLRMQPPVITNRGLLFASGATVPTDGTDGYQVGCLFQHTDGGAGTALYLNEGSVTSCDFNPIDAGDIDVSLDVGEFSSLDAGSGIALSSDDRSAVAVYGDDNGLSIASNVYNLRTRLLLTVDQAGASIRALMAQLKCADGVDVETGIYTASQGYLELAGTHIAKNGATLSCIDASLEIGTKLTTNVGGEACGIHVETTGAGTITNNGTCAGILIDKAAGAADWPMGLYVLNSTIGIDIGTATTGLNFSGTYTGNAIDFSNATIDPTGSNGPCFIRAGTYASPIDYGADNHQSGMMRLYSTCSGDSSSYDRGIFIYTETTGAKAAFPVAGLAEANNTGTGPRKLQAAQFIAHLGAQSSGAHLVTLGGDATAGMYAAWLKVAASGTAVCDSGSRVACAWVDNQMSGTVSGEEYGIFATTGASRPDAFIGFETTSSGYDQLLYFDETFNSGAGTCITTEAVPGTQDARIKVYYDGKQYYLALYR